MNLGKYVFSQLIEFLSHNEFNRYVSKYRGNYKVKSFSCWHQLLCMMFGQLSSRESLSDLILCLRSQGNSCYHLGMGRGASKTNLARANEKRDYRIYESFASSLIIRAQSMFNSSNTLKLPVDAPVYAIDATVIDLCLNLFWWGKFRKYKAAVKVHTMLDVKTNIPTVIFITSGGVHEVNLLGDFPIEEGSYYLLDKGYIEFEKLYNIDKSLAYFVMPAKENLAFVRIDSRAVNKQSGIRCDQTIRLKNQVVSLKYPGNLRRVKYRDAETKEEMIFLTNNFEMSPLEVAALYKYRWKIELFFKWIKQHLKVKTFWGHSFNAVKTQIYIAIITYVLVAIIKQQLKLKQSQYEVLQILSISLLCKVPITDLFIGENQQYVKELNSKQLSIFK